jgi:hypothetical protein
VKQKHVPAGGHGGERTFESYRNHLWSSYSKGVGRTQQTGPTSGMVEANRRAWLNGGVISNYTYEATQQLQTTQCVNSVITPFYRFSGLAISFQIADANAGGNCTRQNRKPSQRPWVRGFYRTTCAKHWISNRGRLRNVLYRCCKWDCKRCMYCMM